MSFLDDQESFASVFGNKPQLLGSDPSRLDTRDIGDKLRSYADKCMFNIFLNICREDYVGTDDGTSDSKMVYEICKKIAELRMEWRTSPGNKLLTYTPDELYAKYTSIVVGLPDNATVWLLPLCNTYFSALVGPLQDKMDLDNFRMPGLDGHIAKTLQLGALRTNRSAAAQFFKSLNNEEKCLRSLLYKNVMNRGSHNLQEQVQYNQTQQSQGYQPQPYNKTDGSIYFHSLSLAEDTLRRYGL